MIVTPHPPYSLDMAPCDFFLFSKKKFKLKGCCIGTMEEIQHQLQIVLDTLKEWDFQEAFHAW